MRCKNCNNIFEGNFCNKCGQSANSPRINGRFLWRDFSSTVLHMEKGFAFTVKEMFTCPGLAVKNYIEGKRVGYYNPFSFVILWAGIYSFFVLFFKIKIWFNFIDNEANNTLTQNFMSWAISNYALLMLLIIPFQSLCSYIIFKKQGYNYFEHIVINSYLTGIQITIGTVLLLAELFVPGKQFMLFNIIGHIFAFWAYYQIFTISNPFSRIFKTFLVFISTFILTITINSIIIIILLILGIVQFPAA